MQPACTAAGLCWPFKCLQHASHSWHHRVHRISSSRKRSSGASGTSKPFCAKSWTVRDSAPHATLSVHGHLCLTCTPQHSQTFIGSKICLRVTPQFSAVRRSVRGSPRSPSQPCIIHFRMPLMCYTHKALTIFHAITPSIDIQCTPLRQLYLSDPLVCVVFLETRGNGTHT